MTNKRSLRKGKTYEEIYGIKRAKDIKKKSSDSHKGQIPTNIEQLSKINTGKRYVAGNKFRLGKKHTQETKIKLKRQRTVILQLGIKEKKELGVVKKIIF